MTSPLKVAVFLSGRGSNMRALVKGAKNFPGDYSIELVVSNNKDAPGVQWAVEQGIPVEVLQTKRPYGLHLKEEEEAIVACLRSYSIDIIALAGYMKILQHVLSVYPKILNIHPSYLPDFKGRHGVRDALESGAKETGCTVHWVDTGVDTGPIIAQRKVAILPGDTEGLLAGRILEQENALYPEVLLKLSRDRGWLGSLSNQ